jgi:hypothetical protein
MEALTRLVADSLARHGFDRPVDFRRLQWSRWFHCDSHHSLLYVPSKPGVFALAEEIVSGDVTAASDITPGQGSNREGHDFSPANKDRERHGFSRADKDREGHDLSRAGVGPPSAAALAAEVQQMSMAPAQPKTEPRQKRMLAVTQFFEAEDMAFVLDRMLSRPNPMRARLESGRYFIRFVVIDDQLQRRTVASALNQWIVSAAEKASGLGSHFASSLELTPATEYVARTLSSANAGSVSPPAAAPQLDSGAASNIHCPPIFPSGF